MAIPDFPEWFTNAAVIGDNTVGEALSVGIFHDTAWLARHCKSTNSWVTVRPANREEIGRYDEIFMAEMHFTLPDDTCPS